MKTSVHLERARGALPVIVCAFLLIATIVIAHPVAEIPMGDDFSYISSAQILARTGHIAYVGFSEPILGWQLFLGALFIKVFGFSFTAVRASMMVLAVVTACVCHRTFVRSGIQPWNATVGTLTLVLSPLYIEQATTFQTDLAGLFAVLLCLYACLRALQAPGSTGSLAWVGFAVISNALLGTARQVAWLGFLIMAPATLWLLRRNRRVLVGGAAFYLLGVVLISACLLWFHRQPYTQHEALFAGPLNGWVFHRICAHILRIALEMIFLGLPVMIIFLPALLKRRQPWQVYALALPLMIAGMELWKRHEISLWLSPFLATSYVWPLSFSSNVAVTILVAVTLLALVSAVFAQKQVLASVAAHPPFSNDRSVEVVILPFAFVYVVLMLLRSGFEPLWDRYMLPLILVALIVCIRFYQGQSRRKVPVIALLFAVALGGYGAALSHDNFAYNRARLVALQAILAKGVPATEITGGWDFDALTELQISGHVYGPHVVLPKGTTLPASTHYGINHCVEFYCDMFPHILPKYALSERPDPEVTQFPPVRYRTWVTRPGTLFVVRFQ